MAMELYAKGGHACVMFSDLVTGEAVQANQFLIVDNGHAALLDPGGELTYTRLFMAVSDYTSVKGLDYVIASHQDPDIVASLNRWLVGTDCRAVVPELWERFIPHFTSRDRTRGRLVTIPDRGMDLRLGNIRIKALPAHFLHAEGNFQFYDPQSKILFSGDLGASIGPDYVEVSDFDAHVPYMEGFHRRYMPSGHANRAWAAMARGLDIEMIVPQHGAIFPTAELSRRFIDWVAELPGAGEVMQSVYRIPT